MPFLSKLYVWSIIFEPLLFFVLIERTATGVGANASRIFQLAVGIGLIFRLFTRSLSSKPTNVRRVNLANPLFIYYEFYFVTIVLAGFIVLLSGAYFLTASYGQSYGQEGASRISQLFNSATIRPLFEYGITLYYFVYFSLLPQYFLKTEKSVEYFLSFFKTVFIISFVAGLIDFGFSFTDNGLIPRHFFDWRMVGNRFHGFAGEPRDAFVYLFLGLNIFYLQSYFRNQTLSKWWVIGIIIAACLTQSASGMLGLIFFLVLYTVYSLSKLTPKRIAQMILLFILLMTLLYFMVTSSERLMKYWEGASVVWFYLESGRELPFGMFEQMANIYPLYDLTVKFRDLNILPILIGSGLGSASATTNFYYPAMPEINNPHSQFVRLIYESGIIGTYFFIMAFFYPVKYLTKHIPKNKQSKFILLTLLLLGCVLGHRSAASFIYLGIFIAVFRVMRHRNSAWTHFKSLSKPLDTHNVHNNSVNRSLL